MFACGKQRFEAQQGTPTGREGPDKGGFSLLRHSHIQHWWFLSCFLSHWAVARHLCNHGEFSEQTPISGVSAEIETVRFVSFSRKTQKDQMRKVGHKRRCRCRAADHVFNSLRGWKVNFGLAVKYFSFDIFQMFTSQRVNLYRFRIETLSGLCKGGFVCLPLDCSRGNSLDTAPTAEIDQRAV